LLRSPAVRRAFELEREPEPLRSAYGAHRFGQGCLLARRLLEAGVTLVTVYWHYEGPDDSPGWDTHQNNFAHLRNRLLPPTDQAGGVSRGGLGGGGPPGDRLLPRRGGVGPPPKGHPPRRPRPLAARPIGAAGRRRHPRRQRVRRVRHARGVSRRQPGDAGGPG